jgi:uncharacterized membrane protein
MYAADVYSGSLWWLCPILMVVFCFLIAKRGKGQKMCGFITEHKDTSPSIDANSAIEILNKRYALGEIEEVEYERKKTILS